MVGYSYECDRFRELDGEFCVGSLVPGLPASVELAALENYLARNLFSWIRADYRAESGGKVTAFWDKVVLESEGAVAPNARSVDPAHAFSQVSGPNQVNAPTLSAAFGNREVVSFTGGGIRYQSTLAAVNWSFWHSGTGSTHWIVWAPTENASTYSLLSTHTSASTGGNHYWTPTTTQRSCYSSSTQIAPAAVSRTFALNTATWLRSSYQEGLSPEFSLSERATVIASGASSAAPTAGAPGNAMVIGNLNNGSQPAKALYADVLFASKVDVTLDAAVARYFLLRYGLS